MYKPLRVEGGWHVFLFKTPNDTEPELVPRPTDNPEEKYKPYPKRQAAYRRSKKLNDAVKDVDKMIARDGAIII